MKMIDFIKSKWLYEEFLTLKQEDYIKYHEEYNRNRGFWCRNIGRVLKMIELREEWMTYKEIANLFNCTHQNVQSSVKLFYKKSNK